MTSMQIPIKKKTFMNLGVLMVGLLFTGAIATFAYWNPATAPTGGNVDVPIDITETNQVKDGGLSVNAFTARGNALFTQQTIFKGTVRGSTPAEAKSTVTVSGDISVLGSVHANDYLNAASISHPGDSQEKPLCSDSNGVITICK